MQEYQENRELLNSDKLSNTAVNTVDGQNLFLEIISTDLEKLLSDYKDPKKGLRIVANKTGIHEKTLGRILQKENKPSPQTLLKFYRQFYSIYNDQELIKKLDPTMGQYLSKYLDQDNSNELEYSNNSDQFLLKNPVAHEIFLVAASAPIRLDFILAKFGQYGRSQLEKLIELKILKELQTELYILGPNRPVFEEAMILKSGLILSEAYANLEKSEELDQNFIGFFVEGLSEEAYQQWLAIDEDAFRKKMDIVKNKENLGNEKVFTFMISERLEYRQKEIDKKLN